MYFGPIVKDIRDQRNLLSSFRFVGRRCRSEHSSSNDLHLQLASGYRQGFLFRNPNRYWWDRALHLEHQNWKASRWAYSGGQHRDNLRHPHDQGNYSFGVKVTDSSSALGGRKSNKTATATVTMTVAAAVATPAALAITTSSLLSGTQGAAYSNAIVATGGTTPYSWSITSGSLPAGLSLTCIHRLDLRNTYSKRNIQFHRVCQRQRFAGPVQIRQPVVDRRSSHSSDHNLFFALRHSWNVLFNDPGRNGRHTSLYLVACG